jgi:large subunit ribosomal protein L24
MKKHSKYHVKIGDKVKVISGDEKGFIGNVSMVYRKKNSLTIEGTLPRIKYSKNNQGGEALKKEIPVLFHVSNVMLWDKDSNTSSRIGYKEVEKERKRYFKKSGNLVD